jgi:hypothetical protein
VILCRDLRRLIFCAFCDRIGETLRFVGWAGVMVARTYVRCRYFNNLRALVGAAATMVYGISYSFCSSRGIHPGVPFWLGAALGVGLLRSLASSWS